MPTLREALRKSSSFKEKPIFEAHWLEHHWIYPSGDWTEGARALVAAFPKDTRPERPAKWYHLLRHTHWPDRVPPGNGPFYIPEWVLETEEMEDVLKAANFRKVVAHVAILPFDSEYLVTAMRIAKDRAWNADPILFRVYVYPKERKFAKTPLREYNTAPLFL